VTLVRTAAPAALPISLIEARAIARLDGQEDDAVLAAYLRSATEAAERYLGMSLITSTWQYSPPGFLWLRCIPAIRLPIAPVQAVTQITYVDQLGDTQVMDPELYLVTGIGDVARISMAPGQSSPSMLHRPEALTITFTAGYGDDWNAVPEPIRTAIGEAVRHLYDGCGHGLPEHLLQPYRIIAI
jgi:uncharacterized phiE125 gp8 family phage protein